MAAVHTGQALANVPKIQGICWSIAKNLAISVPQVISLLNKKTFVSFDLDSLHSFTFIQAVPQQHKNQVGYCCYLY